MTSAIGCPLWLSAYECQRVECAFTFPVTTVVCVWYVCDGLFRVGIYMFAIVMCLVLLICTLTI